jgi:arylsulfatase A-like enzyme
MPETDRPNVLFILLDELRPDVFGCAGHPFVETPTVDGLADNGVRFDSAFTNAPQCTPARAALMTSLYPHQNEIRNNEWFTNPEWVPPEFHDYLAFNPRLRDAGYEHVVNVGKWHVPVSTEDAGFTRDVQFEDQRGATPFTLPEGYAAPSEDVLYKQVEGGPIVGATHPGPIEDTYTAQGVSAAIEQVDDLDDDEPWFLRLSLNRPHTPVIPPEPYASMYEDDVSLPTIGPEDLGERPPIIQNDVITGFSDDELRRLRARYLGFVTFIDDQLSRLIEHLEAVGAREDTLIVFTADHGSAIGDRGRQTKGTVSTPETAGVPLVFNWPAGGLAEGFTYDNVTQFMDIYPTILDLVGVDIPDYAEGEALTAALRGHAEPIHDEIFIELTLDGIDRTAGRHMETVRTDEWRYTRYPGVDQAELIDLVRDSEERRDVSSQYPERVEDFESRLDDWLAATPPIGDGGPTSPGA